MKFSYVPSYGFGKEKKIEWNKTDQLITPGPGKFEQKKTNQELLWRIGTSKRLKGPN